jgi:hypothetical protein
MASNSIVVRKRTSCARRAGIAGGHRRRSCQASQRPICRKARFTCKVAFDIPYIESGTSLYEVLWSSPTIQHYQ